MCAGFGGPAVGVRTGGAGDVTATHRLWRHPIAPQRIGSGVVKDGYVYIHNDPGTVMCIDLHTGNPLWSERMKPTGGTGQNWSSVMLAGDRCYTITQGGDCFVFKADPKLRGDYFLAFRLHEHPRWKPPAISIVRGESRGLPAVSAVR